MSLEFYGQVEVCILIIVKDMPTRAIRFIGINFVMSPMKEFCCIFFFFIKPLTTLLFRIASEMNNKGDYFPILGICLGFELLTYVAANKNEHRIPCYSQSQALPLMFRSGERRIN